jgi:hypothetical protein
MSLQKQNTQDEGDLESYRSFGSSGSSPKKPPTGNAIRFPNALNRQTLLANSLGRWCRDDDEGDEECDYGRRNHMRDIEGGSIEGHWALDSCLGLSNQLSKTPITHAQPDNPPHPRNRRSFLRGWSARSMVRSIIAVEPSRIPRSSSPLPSHVRLCASEPSREYLFV